MRVGLHDILALMSRDDLAVQSKRMGEANGIGPLIRSKIP